MASTIIVLTPNGRRQTVKVTPNTTILQILEEACQKQGFEPNKFDIKHHKKVLDTTTIIRFSGLPNNALLELTEAAVERKDSQIVLGLQMEDGKRLMGNFTSSDTLIDIVKKLCPEELKEDLVVIYMRQEIYGLDKLKNTNLKSLGLTGGRAMLRLVHRSPEELKVQANISAPLPVKPVEEKPYVRQLQRVPSEEKKVAHVAMEVEEKVEDKVVDSVMQEDTVRRVQVQKKNDINALNVIKQEKRKQTQGIKTKNGGNKIPEKEYKDDFVFLGDRNAMLFSVEMAQSVQSRDLPDDFFELSISDIKHLFKDIKKRRLEMENCPLMTAAMRELENSKKQLRQLNQYKKAIIRVQFPSRHVLQGIFTPTETIETVMNFVKEYLEDGSLEFHLFTTPPKCVLSAVSRLIEVDCVPGALLHFGCEEKRDNFLKQDLLDKLTSPSVASYAANKVRDQFKSVQEKEDEEVDLKELLQPVMDVNVGASTSAGVSNDYENYCKKPVQSPPEKVPKWFKPSK